MVIECSSCHARFKLADDKVKESGTKVRCTKCREVFTVFPETSPPITPPAVAVAPVKPVILPVVTQQQKVVDDALFSGADTSSVTPPPSSTVNLPVSEEDDWNQDTAAKFFADEFTGAAGSSDIDAINFDNIEAPVFSVSTEKEKKFEFSDETAFSITDLSHESGREQPYEIAGVTDARSLSEKSENDFTSGGSTTAPPTPSSEELSPLNTVASDFTFSGEDNFADFSWDEPVPSPISNTLPERSEETGVVPPHDAAFDFSSFSFDDNDAPTGVDENNDVRTISKNETTIELSLGTETAPAPVETSLPLVEIEAPPFHPTRERHESTPLPARPLRPRMRQKKKGSNRLALKAIIFILLALAATYGITNRELVLKTYNNIVSNFIDNQTRLETSGRIGLSKLSGNYVANSQEGDFFVIRGEAVNEYKGLRSSVLVKGTILGDNGAILQSQTAYCGNPIKDSRLKKLSFKEIRHVMSNELGENLVNLNIATGKGIPFTIVFNNVPKNIKEFTVEVLESKPGSK